MLGFKLAACVVTLLVSLVLPLALPFALSLKYRGEGLWKAWLVGAAGFVVPQVLIRLPILSYLGTRADFVAFAQNHLLVYALGLAFTAGLFELSGRYAGASVLRKDLTFRRAVIMGLGHGGIEAIILVGLSYVRNIAFLVSMMTGAGCPDCGHDRGGHGWEPACGHASDHGGNRRGNVPAGWF